MIFILNFAYSLLGVGRLKLSLSHKHSHIYVILPSLSGSSVSSRSHITYHMYVAGISGYVAANMYRKMGGESWVWNINLTSALFAG